MTTLPNELRGVINAAGRFVPINVRAPWIGRAAGPTASELTAHAARVAAIVARQAGPPAG